MHLTDSIRFVRQIFQTKPIDLPEAAGVYAFWWLGEKQELLDGNRHIILKGPNERPVDVEYKDWWPAELPNPCLYVGKSTNIKKRFSLHIKRMKKGRLHQIPRNNIKQRPVTTSCQLRYGIEHVFRENPEPLELIFDKVGFSFSTEFPDNAIAERFFAEDLLIGTWKPWFNVDSER